MHGVDRELVPGIHVEGVLNQGAAQIADEREPVDGAVAIDGHRVHKGTEREPIPCRCIVECNVAFIFIGGVFYI